MSTKCSSFWILKTALLMIVRPASFHDLGFVSACMADLLNEIAGNTKYTDSEYEGVTKIALEKENYFIYIASSIDEEKTGVITIQESFSIYNKGFFGIINECYVAPKYRAKGIGKGLIEAAKKLAREKKWGKLEVTSPPPHLLNSTGFYLSNHFVLTGEKLKYIPDV